jgi:hypothetical protein
MSRLERGAATNPRLVEVAALLDIFDRHQPGLISVEQRETVFALVRESREGDWITEYKDVTGSSPAGLAHQRYVELETDATELLSYETGLVPGLLQSPDYARAVVDVFREDDSPEQKERFVDFRRERQRRLGDRRLHVVIHETALRRGIGSAEVMSAQLRMLADEIRSGRPNVKIQIAPLALAIPAATRGPFVLMRLPSQPDVVYVEDPRLGGEFQTKPDVLQHFEAEFAALAAHSLDHGESLALIEKLIGE